MNKQQLVQFAQVLGLKKIDASARAGWVIARCPFARWRHEKGTDTTPSFALKVNADFCHCFSCDWSSSLSDMVYRLAVLAKGNTAAGERIRAADHFLDTEGKTLLFIGKQADDEPEVDDIVEWPEWVIASYLPAYGHAYLQGRKGGRVPEAVAQIMDFRLDTYRKRLGVPVRDWSSRLVGFHGRSTVGSDIPYLAYKGTGYPYNRSCWLGEHWLDIRKPVLVAESVFDLGRCLQVYRNSVCPLMASLNKLKVQRMAEALEIVLLFDGDAAGQKATHKMKQYLPDSAFCEPGIPAGYKDPGEMEVEVLAARLKPYLDLDPLLT